MMDKYVTAFNASFILNRPNLSYKQSYKPSIHHLHTDLAALRTVMNPLDISGGDAR